MAAANERPSTTSTQNVALDLWSVAERTPEAIAAHFGPDSATWTYARLAGEAGALAAHLRARGVRPDDRVAIVAGNWPEHVAAWYGALAAGATVVDVNHILQDDEWRFILADCAPTAVVCGAPFAARVRAIAAGLPGSVETIVARECGEGFGLALDAPDATLVGDPVEVLERHADDLALLCYTSGTTGLPKGVMHSHGRLRAQLELLADVQGYTSTDVVYAALPLFAIHAYLPQVASTVRAGGTVVLAERFDPEAFALASHRYPISYLTLAVPMLDMIMRLPDAARPVLPALRLMTAGGAPLQPEVRRRFESVLGVPVSQGFSMTEIMGVLVADYEGDAPWGSCGRARPLGTDGMVVLDDDGNQLGPDEVGEFAVRRDLALVGYWGLDAEDDVSADGGWFRTGDIGTFDADGFCYVLDRKKDVIIRGGFNIYSAEVERVLNAHEVVAEATVVGMPDERLGEVPVAFVVLRAGAVADEGVARAVIEHARERLGSLKAPTAVTVVEFDDLPRNALGKVRKRELRASLGSG